jgi:hypothetical protein
MSNIINNVQFKLPIWLGEYTPGSSSDSRPLSSIYKKVGCKLFTDLVLYCVLLVMYVLALFWLYTCMLTLPPGVNPVAVNSYNQ